MKQIIYSVLKGKFLIDNGAYKKWSLIIFFSTLAVIVIASSHNADSKVYKISKLNEEVKALRSNYVEIKSELISIKMESFLTEKMKEIDIYPSEDPPVKILIDLKKNNP